MLLFRILDALAEANALMVSRDTEGSGIVNVSQLICSAPPDCDCDMLETDFDGVEVCAFKEDIDPDILEVFCVGVDGLLVFEMVPFIEDANVAYEIGVGVETVEVFLAADDATAAYFSSGVAEGDDFGIAAAKVDASRPVLEIGELTWDWDNWVTKLTVFSFG